MLVISWIYFVGTETSLFLVFDENVSALAG